MGVGSLSIDGRDLRRQLLAGGGDGVVDWARESLGSCALYRMNLKRYSQEERKITFFERCSTAIVQGVSAAGSGSRSVRGPEYALRAVASG